MPQKTDRAADFSWRPLAAGVVISHDLLSLVSAVTLNLALVHGSLQKVAMFSERNAP